MDFTRLSDLPNNGEENITYNIQNQPSIHSQVPIHPTVFPPNPESTIKTNSETPSLGNTNYMPLNVHPNPYASGPPPHVPNPPPQQQPPMPPMSPPSTIIESSADPIEYLPKEQVRIPNHDISIDPFSYTHDESIQANYIPESLSKIKVRDYIKEYDETEGQRLYEHETEKAKKEWYNDLFHSFQNPILLFLIFYISQMQVIKRLFIFIFHRFGYIGKWVITEDGSVTNLGMIFKAILFSGIYLILNFILSII